MLDLSSLLAPLYGGGFGTAYAQLLLFYYSVGLLLHSGVPAIMTVHSVQVSVRKPWSIQRDALYSLGPLAVKAGIWAMVEWLHRRNWGMLYTGPITSYYQVAYMLLTIAVLDYLHDAWFYLTHRLLHWGPLYRHVHYIHHKSSVPSAFTGYSFHLVEAVIVFANELIVCFLFPIHMGLHRFYHLWTTAIHQGGHVGYELAPFIPSLEGLVALSVRGLCGGSSNAPPPRQLNTVQHHDMHHRYPTRHFSLYFTHLDRIFGTMHPKYDAEVQRFFNERQHQHQQDEHDAAADYKGHADVKSTHALGRNDVARFAATAHKNTNTVPKHTGVAGASCAGADGAGAGGSQACSLRGDAAQAGSQPHAQARAGKQVAMHAAKQYAGFVDEPPSHLSVKDSSSANNLAAAAMQRTALVQRMTKVA